MTSSFQVSRGSVSDVKEEHYLAYEKFIEKVGLSSKTGGDARRVIVFMQKLNMVKKSWSSNRRSQVLQPSRFFCSYITPTMNLGPTAQ